MSQRKKAVLSALSLLTTLDAILLNQNNIVDCSMLMFAENK